MVHLYNIMWVYYNPLTFLEEKIPYKLFKRVTYDLYGSLPKRQVAKILQSLYSTLITLLCILKEMHGELSYIPFVLALMAKF